MQAIREAIENIDKEMECRRTTAADCILKMRCHECPLYVSEEDLEKTLEAAKKALTLLDCSIIQEEAEPKGE